MLRAVKISLLMPVLLVFWPVPLLVSIVEVASICIPHEKYRSKELSFSQGKGEQQGKRHRRLQLRICVPTCDRFLGPNIYQRQVKHISFHPVYGSGFDLIVFLEPELNKPQPVLSCRCLRAKVQIEHSCVSLQVNTGVPRIHGCRRKYP